MVVKKKASKKTKKPAKKVTKKKSIKKAPARKAAKKSVKKPAKKQKKPVIKKLKQDVIGIITHYFPHVRAAVIKLKAPLSVGDTIKIKGHTTDFTQRIASLQIDRVAVAQAKKGQEIGLLVDSRVRQHDIVCKA